MTTCPKALPEKNMSGRWRAGNGAASMLRCQAFPAFAFQNRRGVFRCQLPRCHLAIAKNQASNPLKLKETPLPIAKRCQAVLEMEKPMNSKVSTLPHVSTPYRGRCEYSLNTHLPWFGGGAVAGFRCHPMTTARSPAPSLHLSFQSLGGRYVQPTSRESNRLPAGAGPWHRADDGRTALCRRGNQAASSQRRHADDAGLLAQPLCRLRPTVRGHHVPRGEGRQSPLSGTPCARSSGDSGRAATRTTDVRETHGPYVGHPSCLGPRPKQREKLTAMT